MPDAGPAVIFSFVFAGAVAGLTAICYAELASAVPVSGSSYSYAYATMGEGIAMVVAACLLLEYGVASAAVAVGWSQYLNQLLDNLFGLTIPEALSKAPEQGGVFNMPAVVLIILCTLLLIRGASESAKVNAVMVLIKLAVLRPVHPGRRDRLGLRQPVRLRPVRRATASPRRRASSSSPTSASTPSRPRARRSTTRGARCRWPSSPRWSCDLGLHRGGDRRRRRAARRRFEDQEAGLSAILQTVTGETWPGTVLAAGAVISIFSVTLVSIYGQTRILFAMGRDGMIPPLFHRVNPRTLTPVPATIFVAIVVSLLAGLLPINFLAEMTSIGTLVAFMVVSTGVMVLRRTAPDLRRGFKVPGYPVEPILAIIGCIWIISDLRAITIYVFFGWSAVALVCYCFYGMRHSALGQRQAAEGGPR